MQRTVTNNVLAITAIAVIVGAIVAAFVVDRHDGSLSTDEAAARASQEAEWVASAEARATAEAKAAIDAATTAVTFPTGRPLRVAFFGDSMVRGYGASSDASRWPELVLRGLSSMGEVAPHVNAYPGRTATQALRAPLPDEAPDLAFVMLGNNDATHSTPAQFTADYRRLLGRLSAANPRVKIVCVSPWWRGTDASAKLTVAAVRRVCAETGGRYVPVQQNFGPRTITMKGAPTIFGAARDSAHPNDAGQESIASEVLSRISVNGKFLDVKRVDDGRWTPPSMPGTSRGERVVFVGDTWTGGAAASNRTSWAAVLARNEGWKYTVVPNSDGAGYLNPGTANAGTFAKQLSSMLGSHAVSLVLVQGAVSDAEMPLSGLERAVRSTIRLAEKKYPAASVVLIGPTDSRGYTSEDLSIVDSTEAAVAESMGVPYIAPAPSNWLTTANLSAYIDPASGRPNVHGLEYFADQVKHALSYVPAPSPR